MARDPGHFRWPWAVDGLLSSWTVVSVCPALGLAAVAGGEGRHWLRSSR